jgi:hypothetical protein
MMSKFSSEDADEMARMEQLAAPKPIGEIKEVPVVPHFNDLGKSSFNRRSNQNQKMPDFKTRLNSIKAGFGTKAPVASSAPVIEKAEVAQLHPGVEIVPGDMGKPQNELEALVEADRQFSHKVADTHVEQESDKVLHAETLYTEMLAEKSMDRERFKSVFINTVQSECAGLTLDQIEESIRRDHEVLFDKRTGIQAKLAYRAELLKDATAEERAKRLKDDWLFPKKQLSQSSSPKTSSSSKSSASKKPAFDPAAAIKASLKAKGLSDEAIAQRMAKLGL